MGKRTISQAIIQRLNEKYTLIKKDIEYHILKKKGMTFNLEVYDISNIGIISILKMKALFGLMKMETVTFTVNNKDVPLYNIDYIKALKNDKVQL